MASQSKILSDLLDQFEPSVALAFRRAMADWRAGADIAALIRAISANDMVAAVAAMHLSPGALQVFLDELTKVYNRTGSATIAPMPKVQPLGSDAKFTIRWDGRDLTAEAFLRDYSSDLVTNITQTQRDAVRSLLQAGLAAGDNPTTVALDLVGRIGPNGKRQGGVVGLTVPQSEYVASAKAELRSTDSSLLRNYLTRQLRDSRFDGYVARAIESGKAIPADTRTKMLVSYQNRLLKQRGDTIARTETLSTLHAGQSEAIRQTLSTSGLPSKAVRKQWASAHDTKVRHSHQLLDGQVKQWDQPFVSKATGARLMYPGDRSLGAPAGEIINCRCIAASKINFLHGLK